MNRYRVNSLGTYCSYEHVIAETKEEAIEIGLRMINDGSFSVPSSDIKWVVTSVDELK